MAFCCKSADAVGGQDDDDKGVTKRIKKQLNKFERDMKEDLKSLKAQNKNEAMEIRDDQAK